MFFGRRKHAAATPVIVATPATPQLSDELVFQSVQQKLTETFGDHGGWTVSRRTGAETDAIFHELFVQSLTTALTTALTSARATPEADAAAPAPVPLGLLRAPMLETASAVPEAAEVEPAALSWKPAPITVWADLKRPVTGPIAIVGAEDKAA